MSLITRLTSFIENIKPLWTDHENRIGTLESAGGPDANPYQRLPPNQVDSAGGLDWWGPADPFTVTYSGGSTLTFTANRIYFAAFYVPAPIELLGGFVAQNVAAAAGSFIRAGIYHLGQADGDSWQVGDLVSDFGSQDASVVGAKIWDLAVPVTLAKGWYFTAIGISGASGRCHYHRWLTPGMTGVYPYSPITASVQPRRSGAEVYVYENSQAAAILTGLPASWGSNASVDITTTNGWVYQMLFPKWRLLP